MNTNQTPAFNRRPELDPEPEPYAHENTIREGQVSYQFPRWVRCFEMTLATLFSLPRWFWLWLAGFFLLYGVGIVTQAWPQIVERWVQ